MADRKHFLNVKDTDPELQALLKRKGRKPITDKDLREQRISFAYGNALGNDEITRASVTRASKSIRLALTD